MCQYLLKLCYVVILILVQNLESARILGVFPVPSVSHQVVFSKYVEQLVKQGHELVVMTPNPILFQSDTKNNVTVIDLSIGYKLVEKFFKEGSQTKQEFKRGVIFDADFVNYDTFATMLDIIQEELELPEVQNVFTDKSQHFDLIVLEAIFDYTLYVTKLFDAPVILMSSFYGTTSNYAAMGAVRSHPMIYPNWQRYKLKNLSLYEKINELYLEWKLYHDYEVLFEEIQNERIRKKLGDNAPTLHELRNNIDMLFLNSHSILDNNRPVPPNVIYLGSNFHLKPRKDLPKDLQAFLDNSKRGVIYVSLGTNVKTDLMHKELLNTFLNAFKALPYDILWKFDNDKLDGKPDNVYIQKWFPQRDLLFHPNIKLFIMQGGLQSTDEAVDAGVPMVVIPFLGDQFFNAHRAEDLGIGVRLTTQTMITQDIINGVNEILGNDSYRENIKKFKEIKSDSFQNPWEKSVWWTEYVIRHKGAKHLRASGANVSWSSYLILDVVAALLVLVILVMLSLGLALYYVITFISRARKPKLEVKKNN